MTDLTGQHALITGGGTGVGAAIAAAMARAGAKVTIASRRLEPLQQVAAKHNDMHVVQADVTDEASVRAMVSSAREAHGPITIAVANAGAAQSAPFHKTTPELWHRMIEVNLTGTYLTAAAVTEDMIANGWGRIICVASTAGLKGYAYVAPYCAAKHGVVGMVEAMALELARDNVTVNALCPGFIDTPLLQGSIDNIMRTTGRSETEARASLAAMNPQGRLLTPDEVAAQALWLCRNDARSITGTAISISGGEV